MSMNAHASAPRSLSRPSALGRLALDAGGQGLEVALGNGVDRHAEQLGDDRAHEVGDLIVAWARRRRRDADARPEVEDEPLPAGGVHERVRGRGLAQRLGRVANVGHRPSGSADHRDVARMSTSQHRIGRFTG
jgi:hypothetical protein